MRSSISYIRTALPSLAAAVCIGGCVAGDEDASSAAPEASQPPVAASAPDVPGAANPSSEPTAAADLPDQPSAATIEPDLENWATFDDAATGISFRYPQDLGTQYIRPLDWPPKPLLETGPFVCMEAGDEIARTGRTERTTIGDRNYCVTRITEGAAGSIYTIYAYAMPLGSDVVILTFSTRATQCGNYDEPERGECEHERETFSMDPIIDAIARTVQTGAAASAR